jgi:hypothetical protein
MTLAQIVARGRGRAGHWRIEPAGPTGRVALVHHATPMLAWDPTPGADPDVNVLSIGWGSVSDQHGCNVAFRVLGAALRYDRDQRGGGARVTALCRCAVLDCPHDPGACRGITQLADDLADVLGL